MSGLPMVYHPAYSPPLPENHRFPMAKFARLAVHLEHTGLLQAGNLFTPRAATFEQIALAHCPEYIRQYLTGELDARSQRRIGLPWTEEIARRTVTAVGGSLLTARLALSCGLAAHLAGGTHHAHYAEGSGFCIFNDLAIVARYAVAAGWARRVLIIDCDVHQGDGTARILADDSNVITCSFHCRENFPYRKAISDLDVEIPRGSGWPEYEALLRAHLPYWLELTQPDLVLYDAGVDVHRDDTLGYLQLDDDDIRRRDRWIIATCLEREIPVSCVIGGGYDRDIDRLAKRHALVHEIASELFLQFHLTTPEKSA